MSRLLAFSLLALAFSGLASEGAASESWVPLGPPGGDVRSLAADPRYPRVLYLGTADGVVYRSDDAGGRWQRLVPGFERRGMSLDDLVVGPQGTLYVGYWEVNGPSGGVARSEDGGRHFTVLTEGQGVRALALAASDPRVVYVGTWHLPWKTTDAGASWHPVRAGMIDDSDVMTLNLDRRDPDVVFATACSGIYRSPNAGGSWSRIRGIPTSSRRTRAFAQDPARAERLYAGTTEGLWASDDGSLTWQLLTRKDLVVNAVLPLPGGMVLVGSDGAGVLKSTDHGRTFTASNEGFSTRFVSQVVVDPDSGRLFAGIRHDRRHGGVVTAPRPDGPWVALGTGLEGREVLSLAEAGRGEDEVVLAGTDDGLFLYAAHCGVWRRLPTVVGGLEVHPRVAHLAAASPLLLAAATPTGLLMSRDGGLSWELQTLGLAADATAVAFSDREPFILVAATALGVFRSDDLGQRFVQVSNGVAGALVAGLSFLPGDPRVLFATTPIGLLRSPDTGQTWARHGGGLPFSDITGLAFASDGRTVFASDFQQGGLYSSGDGGLTWSPLPTEGLLGDRVWALAQGPRGRLLAATAGAGLRELRPEPPANDVAASR